MRGSGVPIGLAILLTIAAFSPLIGAFHWFGVNIATLEQLSRTDPFGLRLFPSALMFARPAIAAIAALATIYAAWIVGGSHPLRASRTLLNAAGTQALLALILMVSGPPVNGALTRLLPMFEDHRTPGAIVRPGHFVLLQEAAGGSIVRQLFGIAAGCVCAAIVARPGFWSSVSGLWSLVSGLWSLVPRDQGRKTEDRRLESPLISETTRGGDASTPP